MAKRRTDEQIIVDLEAKIAQIKAREARRKAASDPALRHVRVALGAIDKGLVATKSEGTRRSLAEASCLLATCLGVRKPGTTAARMAGVRGPDQWRAFEEDAVVRILRENPGSASGEIAAALGMATGRDLRINDPLEEEPAELGVDSTRARCPTLCGPLADREGRAKLGPRVRQ